ncbi:MAG: RagB/SusD family nutrient uptake outer membrane protein [Flavobacteriaceae bacterium]
MKKIVITLGLIMAVFTSCHDNLDLDPISEITPDTFFNDLDEVEIAVNGMYNVFRAQYHQFYIKITDHGSHVGTNNLNNYNQNLYATFSFNSADRDILTLWQSAYQGIYRSNVIINRVQEADQGDYDDYMAEKYRNRLEAEARFVRALLYFNMVRFFGDVPLITEERTDFKNLNVPRTDSKLVYDQIIEDLEFAESHLYGPNWYTSETVDINGEARPVIPSYDLEDFGRPTFSAAKGLLAKVYLTRASWPLNETAYFALAEEKANEVIDSNIYQLADDYHELLSPEGERSREWLYTAQFDYDGLQAAPWGGFTNPAGPGAVVDRGFGRTSPTLQFYRKFEEQDARILSCAKGNFKANGTINEKNNTKSWRSYKYRFPIQPVSRFRTDMNAPILRYADVLLMHAEAAAQNGNLDDAVVSLNKVRARARSFGSSLDASSYGTAPADIVTTPAQEELLDIVFWDRAKELCFEGHSRFDLVRAGEERFMSELMSQTFSTNVNSASAEKPVPWLVNVNTNRMILPIPESEVSANTAMEQNPGYN